MSVGPMGGIIGGVAGSPLAQRKGSEAERATQDAGNQDRKIQNELKAESAAGIGETNGEDHEPAERDADGRRLWERPPETAESDQADDQTDAPDKGRSKDASGECGGRLDLLG